jgi:hypothetical protein
MMVVLAVGKAASAMPPDPAPLVRRVHGGNPVNERVTAKRRESGAGSVCDARADWVVAPHVRRGDRRTRAIRASVYFRTGVVAGDVVLGDEEAVS